MNSSLNLDRTEFNLEGKEQNQSSFLKELTSDLQSSQMGTGGERPRTSQGPSIMRQGRQVARRVALRDKSMAGNQLHPSTDMPKKAKGLTSTKDSEKGAKFQKDTGHEGQGRHTEMGKGGH